MANEHATELRAQGSEFREDARLPGSGNVQARRVLSPQELAGLTKLSWARSLLALMLTVTSLAAGGALGFWALVQLLAASGQGSGQDVGLSHALWPCLALLLAVVWIGIQQHAWFILNHDAAHYRLLPHRACNDALGAFIGMTGGDSMHTYRVTHRLHHNHLYGKQDPDTAIHGGYPRGKAYLWQKLAQDFVGWNAWKTYAYFFGAPAINDDTGGRVNPLNDTSPELRHAARSDRQRVVAFHVLIPIALLLIALYADPTPATSLFGLNFTPWMPLLAYAVLWLLPLVTVLQPILRLRAICEHGAVTDLSSPLTAARSNRTWGSAANWLGRFVLFPHHVNHHLEHHLYPAVPHYHLRRLHDVLQAKGALAGAQVRDIPDTLSAVFAPRQPKIQAKLV